MRKRNKNAVTMTPEESRKIIGSKLSFAAAEAYKLLRTNLTFSVPGNQCRIIGVTSSLQAEGKSITSVNIAYTLAQAGQKVLLLEADLRLPTAAKRLRLRAKPGLSNILVGQTGLEDAVQPSKMIDNLDVITGGEVPPNPAELLGSAQMKELLKILSVRYDTIIVDLPPVKVVSDAMIISKLVSGYVMVVRQNVCDKGSLDEVIRQMEFVDAKILGFVVTGADYQQKSYKHYGRYGHYGYYGSHERYRYAAQATAQEKQDKKV